MRQLLLLAVVGCIEPTDRLIEANGDAGVSSDPDAGEVEVEAPDAGTRLAVCAPAYADRRELGSGPNIAAHLLAVNGYFAVASVQPSTFHMPPDPPIDTTTAVVHFFMPPRSEEIGFDLADGPIEEIIDVVVTPDGFAIATVGPIDHGLTEPQGTFTLYYEVLRHQVSEWRELTPPTRMIGAAVSFADVVTVLRAPGSGPSAVMLRKAAAEPSVFAGTYSSQSDRLSFESGDYDSIVIAELVGESVLITENHLIYGVVRAFPAIPVCAALSHQLLRYEDQYLLLLDCPDRVELISLSPTFAVQWSSTVHGSRARGASRVARTGAVIGIAVQDESNRIAVHFFGTDGSRLIEGVHPISMPSASSYDFGATEDTFGLSVSTRGTHVLHRFSACR